jgi:hypothetical protein
MCTNNAVTRVLTSDCDTCADYADCGGAVPVTPEWLGRVNCIIHGDPNYLVDVEPCPVCDYNADCADCGGEIDLGDPIWGFTAGAGRSG